MSKFLTILFFLFNMAPLFSFDLPVSRISDDSLLRLRLSEAWMIESPVRVLSQAPRIELLETGEKVRISTMEGREEFRVLFSRELIRGTSVTERRGTGQFPGWAQGSWMLTRRKDTGAPTQIRIFLRSDENTHIQFRPFNSENCWLDVVLYGGYVARSIPIGVPFERLYTMRLNDILRLADNKFPIRYFEPDAANYRDARRLTANIRSRLGELRYADDGAFDENGNLVFIETLGDQNSQTAGVNCSGFIKWLIDGILRPVTGERLAITPLKKPFGERGSSFTVNWEESRDVFFGLDWIRNLAAEANDVLRTYNRRHGAGVSAFRNLDEFEVRADNFAYIIVNENRSFVTQSFPGFLHESGYGVEGLYPLLYTLAIDEPFTFYLGAVNSEIGTPGAPRGTPRLRQYHHLAAFIPFFDENGNFRIAVFESAVETSINRFRSRNSGRQVNLVKIPITPGFDP